MKEKDDVKGKKCGRYLWNILSSILFPFQWKMLPHLDSQYYIYSNHYIHMLNMLVYEYNKSETFIQNKYWKSLLVRSLFSQLSWEKSTLVFFFMRPNFIIKSKYVHQLLKFVKLPRLEFKVLCLLYKQQSLEERNSMLWSWWQCSN